jgi:uncharacterized membrane protein YeaQ/YmgE (transglycosylase-associated protein family)
MIHVHVHAAERIHQEVAMYAILILCAGVGTAYMASHVTRRASFRMIDLLIGIVGGLVGLSVAQYFGMAETNWNIGLPLLVACGLTLGLSGRRTAHA